MSKSPALESDDGDWIMDAADNAELCALQSSSLPTRESNESGVAGVLSHEPWLRSATA